MRQIQVLFLIKICILFYEISFRTEVISLMCVENWNWITVSEKFDACTSFYANFITIRIQWDKNERYCALSLIIIE